MGGVIKSTLTCQRVCVIDCPHFHEIVEDPRFIEKENRRQSRQRWDFCHSAWAASLEYRNYNVA